jgi:hypothetical protein
MQILLTPDQESTLWHFAETILLEDGQKCYYFPFFLISKKDGLFERCSYESLPENIKDAYLKQKGIKF